MFTVHHHVHGTRQVSQLLSSISNMLEIHSAEHCSIEVLHCNVATVLTFSNLGFDDNVLSVLRDKKCRAGRQEVSVNRTVQ